MKVAAIGDIVEANKRLQQKGVSCKVHLRDACGRQTMWLELTGPEGDQPSLTDAHAAIEGIFQELGLPVEFDPVEGVNFWVRQ
ncbi:MAG: hypothetical protein ACI360_04010 [Atopobiaceae bacterium]